jgi:fumarylpyruvate hydrolase
VKDNLNLPYPPETNNFHHEVELSVAIGKGGINIPVEHALEHAFGYATSIDLTRRDLQMVAKDKARPWQWSKAFDQSAPIAPIHKVEEIGHKSSGRIWLSVDGEMKQDADLSELIWSTADVISIISHSMGLKAGDIIMTGTPAGVGPLQVGQKVRGGMDGLVDILITIGKPAQG